MYLSAIPLTLLFVVIALGTAVLMVWLSDRMARHRAAIEPGGAGSAIFLFDGDRLVDLSPAARGILRQSGRSGGDRATVLDLLGLRYPDLSDRLDRTNPGQTEQVEGSLPGETARLEVWDRFTRITLSDPPGALNADLLQLSAAQDELGILRAIAESSPQLIWKIDARKRVIWANAAYLELADSLAGGAAPRALGWPARPILQVALPAEDGESLSSRVVLQPQNGGPRNWFEVTMVRRGSQCIGFAVDVTAVVTAEDARRNFVQTLTKTFADLKTGLAIFDRQRRLVLFNPALVDLTGLEVDFLAQRPLVHSVLDRMRDRQVLPEPKDYATWRDQVAALEAAAVGGGYTETWLLPGGRTFRVTGRAHPDGAIAFLFEDISEEASLTREYRLSLEASIAALDLLPQGLVVFSAGRRKILSNRAYERLWESPGTPDPALRDLARPASGKEAVERQTLSQEMARWRLGTGDGTAWDRISARLALAGHDGPAAAPELDLPEESTIGLRSGQSLTLHPRSLPGGALLIEFRPSATLLRLPGDAARSAPFDTVTNDPLPIEPRAGGPQILHAPSA